MDVLRQFGRARDDSRRRSGWQTQALFPVELRILKGREALDLVEQRQREAGLVDEQLLSEHRMHPFRNRVDDSRHRRPPGRWSGPRYRFELGTGSAHADDGPRRLASSAIDATVAGSIRGSEAETPTARRPAIPSWWRRDMVSVIRWEPMSRATLAATGTEKKNHTCAPFPGREPSTAIGRPMRLKVSMNAITSSVHAPLTRGQRRREQLPAVAPGPRGPRRRPLPQGWRWVAGRDLKRSYGDA